MLKIIISYLSSLLRMIQSTIHNLTKKSPIVYIKGTTGSGKTSTAIALARRNSPNFKKFINVSQPLTRHIRKGRYANEDRLAGSFHVSEQVFASYVKEGLVRLETTYKDKRYGWMDKAPNTSDINTIPSIWKNNNIPVISFPESDLGKKIQILYSVPVLDFHIFSSPNQTVNFIRNREKRLGTNLEDSRVNLYLRDFSSYYKSHYGSGRKLQFQKFNEPLYSPFDISPTDLTLEGFLTASYIFSIYQYYASCSNNENQPVDSPTIHQHIRDDTCNNTIKNAKGGKMHNLNQALDTLSKEALYLEFDSETFDSFFLPGTEDDMVKKITKIPISRIAKAPKSYVIFMNLPHYEMAQDYVLSLLDRSTNCCLYKNSRWSQDPQIFENLSLTHVDLNKAPIPIAYIGPQETSLHPDENPSGLLYVFTRPGIDPHSIELQPWSKDDFSTFLHKKKYLPNHPLQYLTVCHELQKGFTIPNTDIILKMEGNVIEEAFKEQSQC